LEIFPGTSSLHVEGMLYADSGGVGNQTFYISIVLYNASLTAIKITFLLQYYRIFTTAGMRRVVTGALAFVSLWSISQPLVTIFTCTPIEAFWSPEKGGTCIPNLPFWYINAAGNILTDVIVFVVPLPALGGLNLRRSSKMLLLGIFSLGFFVRIPLGQGSFVGFADLWCGRHVRSRLFVSNICA
jgi:hypothetical protein